MISSWKQYRWWMVLYFFLLYPEAVKLPFL